MQNQIVRFIRDDEGQDLIEYVLLGSLIAVVVFVGAGTLGTSINNWYENMAGWVDANAAVPGGG